MVKPATKPLFTGSEWGVEDLDRIWDVIHQIGTEELKLTYAEPRLEIVTYEQMIDAYTSVGLPVMYNHWSFGKQSIAINEAYRTGQQGLAYELVINTDPMVTYIMENNSATMQALVMAHAVVGHGSFFKNNYLFKMWTNPKTIIPYLQYARDFINNCEQELGAGHIETLLDAAHSLQDHGVDRYKKREKRKKGEEVTRLNSWRKYKSDQDEYFNNTILPPDLEVEVKKSISKVIDKLDRGVGTTFPEENILYFIEKNSPHLQNQDREILRIVRKVAQYFYPQRQTKVMNEGWASFCHYYIMTRMHELGYITEGSYLEFLISHTGVLSQQSYVSAYYSGFNPYALGFGIFTDIKRMCENPTEQDLLDCPLICNTPWLETTTNIMENYRDDSFIQQFLSSKLMKRYKMFAIVDDPSEGAHKLDSYQYIKINGVHDSADLTTIRKILSEEYDISKYCARIEVHRVDKKKNTLYLRYYKSNNKDLVADDAQETINYVRLLWGNSVVLEVVEDGKVVDIFEDGFM